MEYGARLFRLSDPWALAGGMLLCSLVVCALLARNAHRVVSFSISWFLITLAPLSNIYPVNAYMAEHWLYLPSIGFFLAFASGLSVMYRKKNFRYLAVFLGAGAMVLYSQLTIRQNGYWKDPATFYERTLRYAPASPRIYSNLGVIYGDSGRNEDAITSFKKAVEVKPDYTQAWYNLGKTYEKIGKYEEAIESLKRAIELRPEYAQAYNDLGVAYSAMGKSEEALTAFRRAIELRPEYAQAYYNLGLSYQEIGRNDEAAAAYEKTIELTPNFADAHYNLAILYFTQKQYALAIEHCDRATSLGAPNPRLSEALRPYRSRGTQRTNQ
jgi:tetratricopeptide (TPR) repeat protein